MNWGGIRKGSRWLEDKLVCAAPGNKAKGQSQANEAGETVTRRTEKRSHKKNIEGKKNRWKKITRRGRKEGESGGGVRMFEEFGSLAVWGVWAIVVGGRAGVPFSFNSHNSIVPNPTSTRLLEYR